MSSKRWQRRKRCVGKRAYASMAAAINACMSAKRRLELEDVNAYHCPGCGEYHWGHLPQKVRRLIEERREG